PTTVGDVVRARTGVARDAIVVLRGRSRLGAVLRQRARPGCAIREATARRIAIGLEEGQPIVLVEQVVVDAAQVGARARAGARGADAVDQRVTRRAWGHQGGRDRATRGERRARAVGIPPIVVLVPGPGVGNEDVRDRAAPAGIGDGDGP